MGVLIQKIALVHDDAAFVGTATTALRAAGHSVVTYSNSMAALNAIDTADDVDILVTRVHFPEGRPNGVSLSLVLRNKYPELKVVYTARSANEEFTADIGELVPHPIEMSKLLAAIERTAAAPSR